MPKTGFAFDDRPTVADIYLVPQLFNARRVGVDLSAYPLILEIDERCRPLTTRCRRTRPTIRETIYRVSTPLPQSGLFIPHW